MVQTKHLARYMNTPKTPKQRTHAMRMRREWAICFGLAFFVYCGSDKLFGWPLIEENMYVSFYDEKALIMKRKYLKG